MKEDPFQLGKLPAAFTEAMLRHAPILDPRVILGPGVGLDCAVIDLGDTCLVIKSDPITFVTQDIGWYAVQICSNDIATTGADPRWFLTTLLLPEGKTTPRMVEQINEQVYEACREKNISVVGGHTEITHGIDHPILMGTMLGEVAKANLLTPRNTRPGNKLLLTKGIPIEGTAILAKEMAEKLRDSLTENEIRTAADFIHNPGISVLRDAKLAIQAGKVIAMHDPTEGGLAAALWEMAEASGHDLYIDPQSIEIPELSKKICTAFHVDPLATIASGALLMAVEAGDAQKICDALIQQGIACKEIGWVKDGQRQVWAVEKTGTKLLPRPARDEIARLFEVK